MSYRKTSYQHDDYVSQLLGESHNVGAGGVTDIKCTDARNMCVKRLMQKQNRCFRAIGLGGDINHIL